ncbi:hypothetical protein [Sphingomonas endophytica]|uniref:hypothetical protein n=1 Tax=Sphingomonas endophytica TaxID=869719 RepID=UPI001F4C66CA|nr:hypothetical protein [Sphingomonas endophytica]
MWTRRQLSRSGPIKEYERFEAIAAQHRRDAQEATLDNVRERCRRSEDAWMKMAAQSRRTEQRRTEREEKAAALVA